MTPNIPQTKIFLENRVLNFTPEAKLEEWKKLIQEKIEEGCLVKLYADTETTGFEHSNKGRPAYDAILDEKDLARTSGNFNLNLGELIREAKEAKGRIDRMIEIAFVACYTNKNGESFPLTDKDGEQVFFHEMIDPYKDSLIEDAKRFKDRQGNLKMPIVPYHIHKTSFKFLAGEEEHPYLKLTLPRSAPSTYEVLKVWVSMFKDNKPENYDKLIMIFHNGDEFDMPFINSEFKRAVGEEPIEQYTLRDLVQVHDSLKLIKSLMPNPVQKLIAFCQFDEFFGGNPALKDDKEVAIQPTAKNLDNIIRIAKFLPQLDFSNLYTYSTDKQKEFANQLKTALLNDGIPLSDVLMEYYDKPNTDVDLLDGLEKEFVTSHKALVENYKKFKTNYKVFEDTLSAAKEHSDIFNSLSNVKKTISEHNDLKENVYLLKNTPREAHGAMVDSLLFMYAFNIIENSLYRNHKLIKEYNFDAIPIKLPDSLLKAHEKLKEEKALGNDSSARNTLKFKI